MAKKLLLDLIDEKIAEARARKESPRAATGEKPKPKPATRAAINQANAKKSTGPKSPEGKAASAANSLKHGFFTHINRLDPADAPTFQYLLTDFRQGLHPDGPVEDLCCRELAMLQARLQRLESIEFALIMGNVEGPPATRPGTPDDAKRKGKGVLRDLYIRDAFNEDIVLDYNIDSRDLAQAFTAAGDALDRIHKIETHLRRAYNRTFDRLQRLQRDRARAPHESAQGNWPERSHRRLNIEDQTTNPHRPPHPKPIPYPAGSGQLPVPPQPFPEPPSPVDEKHQSPRPAAQETEDPVDEAPYRTRSSSRHTLLVCPSNRFVQANQNALTLH